MKVDPAELEDLARDAMRDEEPSFDLPSLSHFEQNEREAREVEGNLVAQYYS